MFVAEVGSAVIGLGGAFRLEEHPRVAHLIAMWVDPAHRRSGAGRALTEAVLDWARRADLDEVMLWVVGENEAARRLYEHAGFGATGESQPLPSNPALVEHQMVVRLGTGLRMPDGYVDLEPMTRAEIRAFLEWAIAERAGRLVDADAMPYAQATQVVRSRIAALLDSPAGTSHLFFTLRAGMDPESRGWLWLTERRRRGTRFAVIEDLVVFEDFRGRGLAASAIESAILHVETTGIRTIEASIPVHNATAIRIAESCGFVELDRDTSEIHVRLDIAPSGR